MRRCTLPGCDRPHRSRGMCIMHYGRWFTYGDGFDRSPEMQRADFSIRLPAGPLLAVLDAELRRLDRGWNGWAKDHGIHPRYRYRWSDYGWVNIDHADIVCDALGLHPCEVWGDEWWSAAA